MLRVLSRLVALLEVVREHVLLFFFEGHGETRRLLRIASVKVLCLGTQMSQQKVKGQAGRSHPIYRSTETFGCKTCGCRHGSTKATAMTTMLGPVQGGQEKRSL